MPSLFTTILNFRDVGEIVNTELQTQYLTQHALYRSARLDSASLPDRESLLSSVGIKTIIDLRSSTEHSQIAEKRAAQIKAAGLAPQAEQEEPRPLQIPGIDYVSISLTGSAYSRHLMRQLSWTNTFRLIGLMAVGRRLEGISVLGTNVMQAKGLSGLAVDTVDVCRGEVKEVFDILADETRYPVLVHCTQGKDRTGLVVQLVLTLLGVGVDIVQKDYMMSMPELTVEREERLKEIHSIGLTDEFGDCDPELTARVDAHIRETYGSVEKYLEECGVTTDMQDRVRKILSGPQHGQDSAP
jgi:protein-tyrosine phosphatase